MENKLTIIIPCYNEEAVLDDTIAKLSKLLRELIVTELAANDSQLCIINDGSTDKTQEIAESYTSQNQNIACIKLSRNFGHQAALMAGLNIVNSDVIISIDADLQDDYTVIPDMLKKYNEGYDVVYGVRNKRSSDSFVKKCTAEFFYSFMKFVGVKLISNHADFRLLSRKAVENLKCFNEKNLFLRGLVPYIGLKSCNVYYERVPRKSGKTKYSIKRMFDFAIDGITAFSAFPLRLICSTGILMFVISLILLLYVILHFSFKILLVNLLLFSNGLILVSLGIIGEYINKIYTETKNRPLYFVEKTVNL